MKEAGIRRRARRRFWSVPCVGELKVDDVQYFLSVCAVVIIDKLFELHLAVGLLGDVDHVHDDVGT